MTQMSDHRRCRFAPSRPNRSSRQGGSLLARALHEVRGPVYVLPFALLVGGCVIPPSLSSNRVDAGANSPPMIVDVKSLNPLLEGSQVTIAVNNPDPVTLDLLDTDSDDTLYVRMFVDYNKTEATPTRVNCPPSTTTKTPARTVVCNISGLCAPSDVGQPRGMSIVVFDRQPLDDGSTPLYQAMPPDGLSTDRFYYLNCQ